MLDTTIPPVGQPLLLSSDELYDGVPEIVTEVPEARLFKNAGHEYPAPFVAGMSPQFPALSTQIAVFELNPPHGAVYEYVDVLVVVALVNALLKFPLPADGVETVPPPPPPQAVTPAANTKPSTIREWRCIMLLNPLPSNPLPDTGYNGRLSLNS